MTVIKLPKQISASGSPVLAEWLQTENQTVTQDQVLARIETADAMVDLKAGTAGTVLKTLVCTGCVVPADGRIAVIGTPGDDVEAVLTRASEAPVSTVIQPAAVAIEDRKIGREVGDPPGREDRKVPEAESDPAAAPQIPTGEVTPILMPQAGQSMEEGTILSWKIKEGDVITVGQPIVEIETDKANMEVEADQAGRVAKILAQEGDIVEIKVPIALLADSDADAAAFVGGSAVGTEDRKIGSEEDRKEPKATTTPKAPSGDVTPILMPQAGQSMEEGTILGWKVQEGDRIEVGQVILEIETDKANMEVEADQAGRVARIVAQEGEIVEIKVPIAYLAEQDTDVDAFLSGGAVQAEDRKIGSGEDRTQPGGRAKASPAARKAAQARGVDLTTVTKGSGPGGRILSTDLGQVVTTASGRIKASPAARRIAIERGLDLASLRTGSGPGGRILSTDLDTAQAAQPTAPAVASGPQTIALTKMRKAIAKNLLWSKQNIPHFYAKRVVEAEKLFATYKRTKQDFKCTVNDFVVRACALAIREYAPFRSQYQDDQIVEFPHVNIGVAVGTDDGLLVPVVLEADQSNLETLASKTRKVVENARAGKLDGVGQGIFTISNMGMFGTEEFSAIVNPPESAILAVGAIREDIKVVDGTIRPTRMMTLTVSVDHRVIDGAVAAQFLNRLKELLEEPEQL